MEEATKKKKAPAKKILPIILIIVLVVGAIFGIREYIYYQHYATTDDAQVDGDISPVVARVSGYVKEIRFRDNQFVHKGDTLVILDDRDFQIALENAQAGLAAAKSGVSVASAGIGVAQSNIVSSRTSIETVDAQIEAAKVKLWRANSDFERYSNLIKDHTITQQQFEEAKANKELAEKQLSILEAQKNAASKNVAAVVSQKGVSSSQVASAEAKIKQEQAAIDAAKLNLSYTVITASVDGQVGSVNLQPGQFVSAGQALFEVVPNLKRWVVANFKETQMTKIRTGQDVEIHVDAFPDMDLKGKVSSISPATGAKMALLPPDNASGNFIKVVQRIPVRIDLVGASDSTLQMLSSGMSVDVDVLLTTGK